VSTTQEQTARSEIQKLLAADIQPNSYDSILHIKSRSGIHDSEKIHQIIAEETGVANTIDPLGGSYFVEALTQKMESGTLDYFRKIDSMGGMVAAIEKGFPQREIQDSAYKYQKAVERGDQVIVGVNKYQMEEESTIPILAIDESVREHQIERLEQTRAKRDSGAVVNALEKLKRAAQRGENTMPATIEAVRAYATLGEICSALRDVYGVYEEPAF